jgi:Rieske Fe-S protein
MKRRDFLRFSGGAAAVCACGVGLSSCAAITGNSSTPAAKAGSYNYSDGQLTLDISQNNSLQKAGGAVKFTFSDNDKNHKMIVARTGADSFLAFEDKCTHGGRELEYQHRNSRFECISFGGSKFNTQGNVISGPADSPLKKFDAMLKDNMLVITI